MFKEVGNKNFYNIVKKIDPEIVDKINTNDHQRLIRVYTVWLQTKKPLSEWQKKDSMSQKIYNNFLKVRFVPERKYLRESIKDRFDDMINSGVIDEVKSIKKYDISLPIMKAHGVREILAYLGFKTLDLVNPKETWPNKRAIATSVGAKDILKKTKVYPNIKEAIKLSSSTSAIVNE